MIDIVYIQKMQTKLVLLLKYTDRKMYILQPLKDKAIEENYPGLSRIFLFRCK